MPLEEQDLNASLPVAGQTPPTQKSQQLPPSSQPHSRLPLPSRTVTPKSAPSRPQWSSRVADRVASAERNVSEARKLQSARSEMAAMSSHQEERPDSGNPSPALTAGLSEKPLPSRPILQLANLQSPSKDSRGLIDASERPLETSSPSGRKTAWPSLTPLSVHVPESEPLDADPLSNVASAAEQEPSSAPQPPATSVSSMVAAAAEMTKVFTENDSPAKSPNKHRSHSSSSSYASASESSPTPSEAPNVRASSIVRTSEDFSTPMSTMDPTTLPNRTSSMRARISSGSMIPHTAGSSRKFMTLTDFTRPGATSPSPSDSRLHSPSPASFSRPRPGSTRLPTPTGSIKGVKTASRLPIPDSKKATVVDVRARGSQNSAASASKAPTFGNRRLDAKTADILDNGIKRRQLQRSYASGNLRRPAMQRAPTNASDATTVDTPAASDGRASGAWDSTTTANKTPRMSAENLAFAASSSEDGSEIATPSDRPMRFSKRTVGRSTAPQLHREYDARFDEEDVPSFPRAPPPTSPFTGLLQTIPSEALLTAHSAESDDETGRSRTQTLSHLEGKGSPPKRDVDRQTLLQMFGHVRKTFDKPVQYPYTQRTSALAENAAAAERFLAMQDNPSPTALQDARQAAEYSAAYHALLEAASPPQPEVSKWSDTTPSSKDNSPNSANSANAPQWSSNPASQHSNERPPPPPPPKDAREGHSSIGYISRVPAATAITSPASEEEVAEVPDILRRQSSPTLGPKQPGSVRSAREGMRGFARTTQAAEARKTSRLPTPRAKTFSDQRGRQPSTIKTSQDASSSKMPRARSKSRYVIDKLNGLFSHKRDKKSETVPPVPRISESAVHSGSMVPSESAPALESTPSTLPEPLPLSLSRTPAPSTVARATPRIQDTALHVEGANLSDSSAVPTSNQSNVQSTTEKLIAQAQRENNLQKKERLLNLAQILHDSLINTREAQISAEQAEHAARRAHMSYELTQRSLEVLQKMVAGVGRVG